MLNDNKPLSINYKLKTISIDNSEIDFTEKQFNILIYFIERSPAQLSYKEIYQANWECEGDYFVKKHVQEEVSKIIKKAPSLATYIENAYGSGYKVSFSNNSNRINIDSPFTESLLAMLTASYPDKRGTNTKDKQITVTRYAFFAIIKKLFPDEINLISVLRNGSKTPEELTEEFSSLDLSSDELTSIQGKIYFDWQINDKGKKTELVVVRPIVAINETMTDVQYKKALNTLMESYLALPSEFHNNVKSLLKRELNTTLSELLLSVAYKGVFNKSEDARSELLSICDKLVKTHNHHNSYLYSLIEKTRDEKEYLFKQYTPDDYECVKAIDIVKSFFEDNWYSEQSASYIGSKFLRWCKDRKVILDLINNHCYDQRIWLEFASKYNGANTIRQIVQSKILKTANYQNKETINNIVSFLQMVTKGDFRFLAYNSHDENYNANVYSFIIYVLQNLPNFPIEKQIMLGHGLATIISNCNGYDPNKEHLVTKKIISEAQINWSLDCYKPIKIMHEKIMGSNSMTIASLDETSQFIESLNFPFDEKNISSQLKEIAGKLRILLLSENYIFTDDSKKFANDFIKYLLDNNLSENYLTIFATVERLYLFPNDINKRIYNFTLQFLENCDYSQQTDTVIKRALHILKHNYYVNSQNALESCFINLNKIKKCRPMELLPILLEGLTTDWIISKIEFESESFAKPYSITTNWLFVQKNNRRVLAQNLYLNIVFDFIDKLIDKANSELLWSELSLSVIHFAKKQDCFADKVPSSDQFYAELLLDVTNVSFDVKYLKTKAAEHNLSFNTCLYHLCKVLKDDPHATAYICIQCLAKFFGQLEYSYRNPEDGDLYETFRFQKRKEILSLLVSNPAIRNTAKLYCSRMRRFARILPASMATLIKNIVEKDEFPLWFADINISKPDEIKESVLWISELNCDKNNRLAGTTLNREIQEQLMPWFEKATVEDVYEPSSFILVINKGDEYTVVDGNRAINHFIAESVAYGDFKIKVWVVKL